MCRLQSGEAPADHRFLAEGRSEVVDALDVDWDGFPMLAALEAVTRDELRHRLRRLLHTDWMALSPVPPPPASRPGTDGPARWGFEPVHEAGGGPKSRPLAPLQRPLSWSRCSLSGAVRSLLCMAIAACAPVVTPPRVERPWKTVGPPSSTSSPARTSRPTAWRSPSPRRASFASSP